MKIRPFFVNIAARPVVLPIAVSTAWTKDLPPGTLLSSKKPPPPQKANTANESFFVGCGKFGKVQKLKIRLQTQNLFALLKTGCIRTAALLRQNFRKRESGGGGGEKKTTTFFFLEDLVFFFLGGRTHSPTTTLPPPPVCFLENACVFLLGMKISSYRAAAAPSCCP